MKCALSLILLVAVPNVLWAQSDLERQQARQAREQAARQQQEATRTQELNARSERLLRDAAQQRLDVLAQQYQSALAHGGTPSDQAALQQEMRDQQSMLRSLAQRQELSEQQLQNEIDRLRTNLAKANAAGLLSAYAVQQRELVIRQHEAELEHLRAERQANAASRALTERQQTMAIEQAGQTRGVRALVESSHRQGDLQESELESRVLRMEQLLAKVATTHIGPQREIVVTAPGLFFEVGGAALPPGARAALDAIARVLVTEPAMAITIEGHTDAEGDAGANQRLSESRARAVRSYLVSAGLSSERVVAVGEGAAGPVASNATAAGRHQNRRVEIIIKP